MRVGEDRVFFIGPAALLEQRVEVVEPTIAALLADAAGDAVSDVMPLGESRFNALDDDPVLLVGPRPLHEPEAQNPLPPEIAIRVGSLLSHQLRDRFPVANSESPDGFAEFPVL